MEFTTNLINFALNYNLRNMDKQTLETKKIERNNISYLQYDLHKEQASTSFFDISSLNTIDKIYPEALQNLHCHNFYCIFWFHSGKGIHVVDFKEYDIEQETMFFLSPKHLHSYRNIKNTEGVAICFTEDFLLRLDNELQGRIKAKLFYPANGFSYCKIPLTAKDKLNTIIKLLKETYSLPYEDKSLQASYLASLLSLFLIDTIRLGEWSDFSLTNVSYDSYLVYTKFIDEVENNFTRFHTIKDYLEIIGVSQTTLNLYTKQYAKTTPLKIINNRIILEAKRLIRYSNLRIKQISFKLGFDDTSYFIKLFKRNAGMSPAEFKKSV